MATYLFRAGAGILEDDGTSEDFWYSANDVHEAVVMFLDEATEDEHACYRVYQAGPGNLYSGEPLRHPQRPELGY